MRPVAYFLIAFFVFMHTDVSAQVKEVTITDIDSMKKAAEVQKVDTAKIKKHSPRKAAIRSAILPGLGQIYNKRYWKLPIVYGALGVSGGVFLYNLKWYQRTRFAYKVLYNKDTASFIKVHKQLQPFIQNNYLNSLKYRRDQFRRDIDYSALFFILLWGLNVVDATVDAHLSSFDISPDLSLKIPPPTNQQVVALTLSLKLGRNSR